MFESGAGTATSYPGKYSENKNVSGLDAVRQDKPEKISQYFMPFNSTLFCGIQKSIRNIPDRICHIVEDAACKIFTARPQPFNNRSSGRCRLQGYLPVLKKLQEAFRIKPEVLPRKSLTSNRNRRTRKSRPYLFFTEIEDQHRISWHCVRDSFCLMQIEDYLCKCQISVI